MKDSKSQGSIRDFTQEQIQNITNIHELDSRFNSVHFWFLKWLHYFRSIVIKWQFMWKLHMQFSPCLKEHLSKLVRIYHHNCVSQWYMYCKIVNVTFSSYIQKNAILSSQTIAATVSNIAFSLQKSEAAENFYPLIKTGLGPTDTPRPPSSDTV